MSIIASGIYESNYFRNEDVVEETTTENANPETEGWARGGCMRIDATNYDQYANVDDGSCEYATRPDLNPYLNQQNTSTSADDSSDSTDSDNEDLDDDNEPEEASKAPFYLGLTAVIISGIVALDYYNVLARSRSFGNKLLNS